MMRRGLEGGNIERPRKPKDVILDHDEGVRTKDYFDRVRTISDFTKNRPDLVIEEVLERAYPGYRWRAKTSEPREGRVRGSFDDITERFSFEKTGTQRLRDELSLRERLGDDRNREVADARRKHLEYLEGMELTITPFEVGKEIYVRRSNGDIESGWKVESVDPYSTTYTVSKITDRGERLVKTILFVDAEGEHYGHLDTLAELESGQL